MEKMMKKPEVEAVRFDDADVIVTSNKYIVKESEAHQAQQNGKLDKNVVLSNNSNDWATIIWNGGNGSATLENWSISEPSPVYGDYHYAWFSDSSSSWRTNDKTWNSYNENHESFPEN